MFIIKFIHVVSVFFGIYTCIIRHSALTATSVAVRKSRNNCRVDRQTIRTIHSSSLTTCILRCLMDQRCLAMSYHIDRMVCELHDACYTGCCVEGSDTGWSAYYPMDRNCPEILEYRVGDYVGGPKHGSPFTDCRIWLDGNITAIKLKADNNIIRIQTQYGSTWSPERGRYQYGKYKNIKLEPDEYITKIVTSGGNWVESLQIFTNKWEHGTYGIPSDITRTSQGGRLLFISGRHGGYIDFLSFHWAKF